MTALSHPLLCRDTKEGCGQAGCRSVVLLQSRVALLCPQLHCECRGPGLRFLSYPKGSRTALLGSTLLGGGARPGLLSGLVVMFLPERWTPGSTTPQLMLHKMLVGSAKCRPATVLGQPGSTDKIFQKALPSLLVKEGKTSLLLPPKLPPRSLPSSSSTRRNNLEWVQLGINA